MFSLSFKEACRPLKRAPYLLGKRNISAISDIFDSQIQKKIIKQRVLENSLNLDQLTKIVFMIWVHTATTIMCLSIGTPKNNGILIFLGVPKFGHDSA